MSHCRDEKIKNRSPVTRHKTANRSIAVPIELHAHPSERPGGAWPLAHPPEPEKIVSGVLIESQTKLLSPGHASSAAPHWHCG